MKMRQGQLPAGWEIKKLGEVSDILNGGTPKTNIVQYWDGEIHWITPADLGKLTKPTTADTSRKISKFGLEKSSAKLFPENSVILSTRAPIGHLAINEVPMCTNQGCRGIVPSKKLDTWFLYYFLKMNVEYLDSLGTGTTFKELSTKALAGVEIPLPSLPEQQRIVSILDEAFAVIAKAKANAEQNLKNAKELFESFLQGVFEKKGECWEEKTLGEVCEFTQGIQRDVKLQSENQNDNQVRFLRIVDFTQGNEPPRYIDNPGDKYILNSNDVSLVRYGASTGFVCRGLEGALANNLFRVIPKSNKISNDFLFVYLTAPVFQNVIKESMNGAAMPAISFGLIKDVSFPLPTIKEQQTIVSQLDTLRIETQKLEAVYRKKIADLEELKKSLLKKAFSGEL